ncbi:MAG: pentapeptide repeat-containing protein [Thermoguttaceae bacterium]|nr:pentapeptide repeat-containing protein [Thermoguttaceae bacterium]
MKNVRYRNCAYRNSCRRNSGLRSSDLRNSGLRNSDLRSSGLRSSGLRNSDLRNSDLRNSDLRNSDLRNSGLRNSGLRSSDLRSSDLRSSDLRSSDLRSSGLRNSGLRNSDLRNSGLRSSDLRNFYCHSSGRHNFGASCVLDGKVVCPFAGGRRSSDSFQDFRVDRICVHPVRKNVPYYFAAIHIDRGWDFQKTDRSILWGRFPQSWPHRIPFPDFPAVCRWTRFRQFAQTFSFPETEPQDLHRMRTVRFQFLHFSPLHPVPDRVRKTHQNDCADQNESVKKHSLHAAGLGRADRKGDF